MPTVICVANCGLALFLCLPVNTSLVPGSSARYTVQTVLCVCRNFACHILSDGAIAPVFLHFLDFKFLLKELLKVQCLQLAICILYMLVNHITS